MLRNHHGQPYTQNGGLGDEHVQVPVEVDVASEFRYRDAPMPEGGMALFVSQSGETADTLAALRYARDQNQYIVTLTNTATSTMARESDHVLLTRAGPEIGVASTKAYTSQCVVMAMLALYLGRLHHLSYEAGRRITAAIRQVPDQVARALDTNEQVRQIAEKYCEAENFLYLGRQCNFPTALEGALKLKEISYIHAEGYPAAEMKHGPIALVDEKTPSVFIVPKCFTYDKVMANLQEIKARGGPVIAVVCEGDTEAARLADEVIEIPSCPDFLQPIVSIVPLQLMAYHIAVARGCDVDKPRNLAKSVTVE